MTLSKKPLQRIRGLFNYYFCFAGHFHSVTNRILKGPDKSKHDGIIKYLLKRDYIPFGDRNLIPIVAYVDASMYRIAAIVADQTVSMPSSAPYIALNELYAALLGAQTFTRCFDKKKHILLLFTDNMNVLYLLLKGSCKWNIS